jgi:AhpD family alkylhydroperoxidase
MSFVCEKASRKIDSLAARKGAGDMSKAWIELVHDDDLPSEVERIIPFMGEVPNSMRAYGYLPSVAEGVINLELALLPEGTVNVLVKARIGYVVSRLNGCRYCASHVGGRLRQNGVEENELACIVGELTDTGDASIDAAIAFAKRATIGEATESDVAHLARYFSVEQIVEIACVVGFYCFLNRVHSALGLPIEDKFERIGAHEIPPATGVA